MITLKEWREGLEAWQKMRKDAEITIEQADLYCSVIENKIKEMELKENGG